ncbi:capsular polysaccharide biosynthesis protein [Cupriavidus sp. 30B13]|uniref:capsular polysaccharide biosynthesis protein n=1 Tax=Cupriavidus sp. 30B13 TaxID=3384241 RepID=UPI003B90A9C6
MIGILSRGVLRIPNLDVLLGEKPIRLRAWQRPPAGLSAIAGWGRRPSSARASALAQACALPYIALEDGFLRSIRPGPLERPLSMVMDRTGIYYDASRSSDLEKLIAYPRQDAHTMAQARSAMDCIRRHRLSKYNHAPAIQLPATSGRRRVLVVDQTAGDMSIVLGGAGEATFAAMLAAAQADHPEAQIWVKAHPEVIQGRKSGNLGRTQASAQVRWLEQECCPHSLIEQFDHIYVVTSQIGFEALLLGKPVVCFGMPWYAGWGLTDDRHPDIGRLRQRRPAPRALEQLFAAAYLQYTRYIHPVTGKPGQLADVVDWLARNKVLNDQVRGTLYCVGMSPWKRAIVRPFLAMPSNRLVFVRKMERHHLHGLAENARIVVWGSQHAALREASIEAGVPLLRVEDGFIRSAGLGSDLHAPLSLALDGPGIYYDPASASQLERLLETVPVSDEERLRAAGLRDILLRQGISKYNIGGAFSLDRESAARRVLLVPGQVEDDASIQYGSPLIRRNRDLLRAVRSANPDAWIVYKPHPDVVAGNRRGAMEDVALEGLADQVAAGANITACIALADEVHTMTSQAGFEALLLGKPVHCYGAPFYAGWGLTIDTQRLPHRRRRLSIEELLFVALCLYPRYRLPGGHGCCAPEDVLAYLGPADQRRVVGVGTHWLGRQYRKARALIHALR